MRLLNLQRLGDNLKELAVPLIVSVVAPSASLSDNHPAVEVDHKYTALSKSSGLSESGGAPEQKGTGVDSQFAPPPCSSSHPPTYTTSKQPFTNSLLPFSLLFHSPLSGH